MKHQELPDTKQSWLQLSVIQLAGWMSLPTLATSILVLQVNSFFGAVLTIIVANAILWFIRLGIVGMSFEGRQSTLDISRTYFGRKGSYFVAGLLLLSTLAWFIVQTTAAGKTLTRLIVIHENPQIDQFTQVSVFLGITSAFLCMEGIVLLRRLSTFALPFLVVAFFGILFSLPSFGVIENGNKLSLAGLTLILATNLGLSSDLPTFFRHSQSWAESVKALLVIQLVNVGLGILSLFLGVLITQAFEMNTALVMASGNDLLRYSLILFITLSVICANVANVYSASVGWEVLAPVALVGRKEYLILGLSLTTVFILVSDLIPIDYLLSVSDTSLVNLCIILVLGSMVAKSLKAPPSPYLQGSYFIAWLLSTAIDAAQPSKLSSLSSLEINLYVILTVILVALGGMKIYPKLSK